MRAPPGRSSRPPVICLAGPTASGKTGIAVHLVQRLPVEIVSVDSAMVYRHMDIGTAKPDAGTLQHAPHALIDIRDPWQNYSAGQFRHDALACIEAIHARGRVPLLVGGTLLYFRALQQGLAPLPAADAGVRADIDLRAAREGWEALHRELAVLDPEAAARIPPTDRQRLQRALEVIALTGRTLTSQQQRMTGAPELDFIRAALIPGDRARLHARIEQRFGTMLERGLVDEVAALRAMPEMDAACSAMRAVGYRQLWQYLDGRQLLDAAVRDAIVATRRLAKRQLTWMRSEPAAIEIDCDDQRAAERMLDALRSRVPAIAG